MLDHRPVIQGEIRYFVKEFEEKRAFREMRVLENLKSLTVEMNEVTLPKCAEAMNDHLEDVLTRLEAANPMMQRIQQREQEVIQNDRLQAAQEQRKTEWEAFMKAQWQKQAEVDEEHSKAMERLKEQYSDMGKDLAKFTMF
nr:PREDICTED: biogenesis of lysosome-related organelles complex 1 subunit 5 isoform X2 [Latimeria chalumnae]|eukprot:XP_006002936.1 PREDICTED: biogenesis of lysosome-related organelles complex 1 subunit 5 isoform X2 [Latimeria chalumnae]